MSEIHKDGYEKYQLLFFTVATGIYKSFVVPYMYFAFRNNPNSAFEFVLDDVEGFVLENEEVLSYLKSLGCIYHLRSTPKLKNYPRMDNSLRFILEPELKAEYVYIGDVDIMIIENIFSKHRHVFEQGLPYSNVIRTNTKKLTGLHFCKYSEQYPLPNVDDLIEQFPNDEDLLYAIMERKGMIFDLEVYNQKIGIRPLHGVHMSLNRAPYFLHALRVSWDLKYNELIEICKIIDSAEFQVFLSKCHSSARLTMMNLIVLSKGATSFSESDYLILTSQFETKASFLIDFSKQQYENTSHNVTDGLELTFFRHMMSHQKKGLQSLSGPSSTLARTKEIRKELPKVFERYEVKSLADAGCGDLNWMQQLLSQNAIKTYIGLDIINHLIQQLKEKFKDRYFLNFYRKDIRNDVLPMVDLILCRDVLFHFSEKDIFIFLQNFLDSGSLYLLTTTHKNNSSFINQDIETGKWRYLDLFQQPYNFPEPLERLEDGGGDRYLCLWSRDQISNIVKKGQCDVD